MIQKIKQIVQITQGSEQWHQSRRESITATDVAAIMGCHPFLSLNQLCQNKMSATPQEPNYAMEWGTKHEPVVKALLPQRYPQIEHQLDLGLAFHPENSFIGASPDGLIILHESREIWLVEIKCPWQRSMRTHPRESSLEIPQHYQMQVQTQLYVWRALLAQKNLTLQGCLYTDNWFETDLAETPTVYHDHWIRFDEERYHQQILPHILQAYQTIFTAPPPAAKRRRTTQRSATALLDKYIHSPFVMTTSHYHNFANRDHVVDWLNSYGQSHGLLPDRRPMDSEQYPPDREAFRSYVQQTLQEQATQMDLSQVMISPIPLDALLETTTAFQNPPELIWNAFVYEPQSSLAGRIDLIIRVASLLRLVPRAKKLFKDCPAPETDEYTFVQFRYGRLKLTSNHLYLLNSHGTQKEFKLKQAHLHRIMSSYPLPMCGLSFVLGTGCNHSDNIFASICIIDFLHYDKALLPETEHCRQFQLELADNGRKWSIDPPSRPELCPNMKTDHQSVWVRAKHQLALRNQELTLLWRVGPQLRPAGVVAPRWTDLVIEELHMNPHYQRVIRNMIQSQLTNQPLNLERWNEAVRGLCRPVMYFVDLEFAHQHCDPRDFPICKHSQVTYLIGCVRYVQDPQDPQGPNGSSRSYRSYLAERLDLASENTIFEQWVSDLKRENPSKEVYLYHWGAVEKTKITSRLIQGLDFHFVDLCQIFEDCEITLPGCFSYGLKDVVKALHAGGILPQSWTGSIDAESSLVSVRAAEMGCRQGRYTKLVEHPSLTEVIQYNQTDCQVLCDLISM